MPSVKQGGIKYHFLSLWIEPRSPGHNGIEVTKNIFCVKGEGAVDRSTVTRWFKTFYTGCNSLSNHARSGRPKTRNSEDMLQTKEANQASSTQRVSGKFGISQSSGICHLCDLSRTIQSY